MKPHSLRVLVMVKYRDGDHPLYHRLSNDLAAHQGLHVTTHYQTYQFDSESVIDEGIMQSADYIIHLHSDDGSTKPNVAFMLAYATAPKGRFIVVLIGGNAPPFLRDTGYLDLVADYGNGLASLFNILRPSVDDALICFDLEQAANQEPILQISEQVNRRLVDYFSRNPGELKQINRRLFEQLVAELFSGFGYEVELTKQTRDGGKDIVAVKRREAHIKFLIECKRPDPHHIVGIRPVRELYAVKNHEHATKAILATTVYFSQDALQFFSQHEWELEHRDWDGLMIWIREYLHLKQ